MTNEPDFLPEERLYLIYFLARNKSINDVIKQFKNAGFKHTKDELIMELSDAKNSIDSGKKKHRNNSQKTDLKSFAVSNNLDIFELSKLLVRNNVFIENNLVDSYSLDVLLGREKEVILPIKRKNLEKILDLIKNELTPDLWEKLTHNYGLIYGDVDLPNYQNMMHTISKPKIIFNKKDKVRYKGVLVKKIYEEWKDHGNIARIGRKFRLSEETIKEYLKRNGVLSKEFVEQELSTLEAIATKSILGLKVYSGKEKQRIREKEINSLLEYLESKKIKYLGLEGNNFISYMSFVAFNNLLQEESLIPERDEKRANIMQSIISNNDLIKGGEIFNGLNVYKGELLDALRDKRYKNIKFNLLNLDYEGGWSFDKEEAIKHLFEKNMLENNSLIFMTLNDTALERIRVIKSRGNGIKGYITTNQYKLASELLSEYAKKFNFDLEKLFLERYSDSVHSMIAFGFRLKR